MVVGVNGNRHALAEKRPDRVQSEVIDTAEQLVAYWARFNALKRFPSATSELLPLKKMSVKFSSLNFSCIVLPSQL